MLLKTPPSHLRPRRFWRHVAVWVRRQRVWVLTSLALSVVVAIAASGMPARAVQASLSPNNPQLGDTLSVVVQQNPTLSSSPTVKMGQKTYPSYVTNSGNFRALLPTTPLDKPGTLQIQVSGEGEVKNLTTSLRNRSFPTQRIRLSGAAGSQATQQELDRVAAFKALETPEKYWNGPFLKPNNGRISSGYGIRRYYNGVFAQDYYHRGVDYAGGMGSPVVAPAAGRIALVGRVSEGFRVHGNTVGIDHGQGVTSIMLHLSRIDVKEGDVVKAGQRIGAIGSTGASTGPHLHWGLYVHGLSVDPVPWRYQGFE
ncbi:MAG TPA: M23 family metallopeptidase [Coleofasciculaceae cyanobacterium]